MKHEMKNSSNQVKKKMLKFQKRIISRFNLHQSDTQSCFCFWLSYIFFYQIPSEKLMFNNEGFKESQTAIIIKMKAQSSHRKESQNRMSTN